MGLADSAWLIFAGVGLLGGLSAGLFGIGGGSVLVPLLMLAFRIQAMDARVAILLAVASSMVAMVPMEAMSAWTHHRHRAVRWDVVLAFAPGVVLGSYLGTRLATSLDGRLLLGLFIVFEAYVGTQLLLDISPKPGRSLPHKAIQGMVGGLIGMASAMVGIGGGKFTVPYLIWHNLPLPKAIGTASAVGVPLSLTAAMGYLTQTASAALPEQTIGLAYLPACLGIVAAGIPASFLGAALAHRLPRRALRLLFGLALYAFAVQMGVELWSQLQPVT
jgi:uncharacterized membrane protein YfcA